MPIRCKLGSMTLAALLATAACAQDVRVRVSPDAPRTPASDELFPTIQMALDHAPQPGRGGRLYIKIAPGVYHERVIVTQNRPRTTMLGMGTNPGDVVITASQNATTAGGTFFSSTVEVYGPELRQTISPLRMQLVIPDRRLQSRCGPTVPFSRNAVSSETRTPYLRISVVNIISTPTFKEESISSSAMQRPYSTTVRFTSFALGI